ncbi:sodium channel, voltage-gated, type IV, beta a [Syngnathus scovelli]|uniref:sodium channel, voltage-gated, type IV, beta a n=1 Tax=Syngnathus scovelli TaxID=161590 RepID=UPI00210FDA33|nr:sodium channel, voltage-gated, type IV, beta a [Syngnathus scovelli]
MASLDSTSWSVPGLLLALLLVFYSDLPHVRGLEVSTGKVSSIEAMNGSTVLLPCTYSSCIGIHKLYFSWHYNNNGSKEKLCDGIVPSEGAETRVKVKHPRIEFVGATKGHNISVLLWNITFEDEGEYICFAKNPKEKDRNHSATYTLYVVDQMREVDNTLTVIIVSVLGGVIGLVIIVMVIKALVVQFLLKDDEKNKECLVNASGNDNTENGLTGAKADNKGTPKA